MEQEYISRNVVETLNSRVSIRSHTNQEISDRLLRKIIDTARRSPTSSNLQTYSIIVVRNPETKKKLAVLAGNQKHIETSSVFLGFCADISRLDVAAKFHNQTIQRNLENTLVATVDAALVGMSVSIVAESFGIGSVMIGGMRNHPTKVAELLGFPDGVFMVYGMSLGWPNPDKITPQKPRLNHDVIVHYEKYAKENLEDKIKNYDHQLATHYRSQGRDSPEAAWTGIIANRFSTGRRPEMRNNLESLGFSFN